MTLALAQTQEDKYERAKIKIQFDKILIYFWVK